MRKAIVIGASSGIGYELVCQLAALGWKVAALARTEEKLLELQAKYPSVIPIRHDVTEYASVPALLIDITGQLGGLDLLIYSSGVMPSVAADEFDFLKDKGMVDVNVLGAVAWMNEGARRMQGSRAGTLMAIGSVAGDRGRAGQPVYNATKAFLHSYMESLRNRLSRLGVHVVTVRPGPVLTPMTAHLHFKKALTAQDAAGRILKYIDKRGDYYLVPAHRLIFFVIRSVPSWIFRRLNI
ncbi:MAG: SDR family NAD(P)-dependent oxidoreductase [Fimbriimonas sp.]